MFPFPSALRQREPRYRSPGDSASTKTIIALYAKRTELTDGVEKGLVIFGEQRFRLLEAFSGGGLP